MAEARTDAGYERNVFINCPFDDQYRPLFEAIVFGVMIAGFRPRCALEASNAGQFRLEKIMALIAACKYGVHDISRTESSRKGLPRFNMPLELGLDLGCREYSGRQSAKRLLIMDRSQHRYQQFISDISGQDISSHGNRPRNVITVVRDWLRAESGEETIPGGDYMYRRYLVCRDEMPALRRRLRLDLRRLPFVDLAKAMRTWLEENQ